MKVCADGALSDGSRSLRSESLVYAQWRHCDHGRSRPSSRSEKGDVTVRLLADMSDVSHERVV